jgi:hypothetical protein
VKSRRAAGFGGFFTYLPQFRRLPASTWRALDVYIMCMSPSAVVTHRINITLPESTIRTLDRLAQRGGRSKLIDQAVRHYVATRSAEALREQLKQCSLRDRDLEEGVSEDWAAVDSESWRHIEEEANQKRGRGAGKSISRRSTRL